MFRNGVCIISVITCVKKENKCLLKIWTLQATNVNVFNDKYKSVFVYIF